MADDMKLLAQQMEVVEDQLLADGRLAMAAVIKEARGQLKGDLLSEKEMAALDLTCELSKAFQEIVGYGPTRDRDLEEITSTIHELQHFILAQAAPRAYPHKLRLLGEVVSRG